MGSRIGPEGPSQPQKQTLNSKFVGTYLKAIESMLFRLETAAYLSPKTHKSAQHMTLARGEIIRARQALPKRPGGPGGRAQVPNNPKRAR